MGTLPTRKEIELSKLSPKRIMILRGRDMLKKLSGQTDQKLEYYLARVREIALLGDQAALIEVDKLIWEILENTEEMEEESQEEQHNFEADDFESDVANLVEETKDIKRDLRLKKYISQYDVEHLREAVEELLEGKQSWFSEKLLSNMQQAINDAEVVANQAEEFARAQELQMEVNRHKGNLRNNLKRPIYNYSSVQSIISTSDEALEFFEQKKLLTNEISDLVNRSKKRAAVFRYQRKLDAAETMQARGSFQKAAGARQEAAVLLKQDWEVAFPGIPVPAEFLSN